jgi:chorismate mutase/prephenate dehydratase
MAIHPDSTLGDITIVSSKDTALRECSSYLDAALPMAERICADSTTLPMKQIQDGRLLHIAAVGSEIGAATYGLRIVERAIENDPNNFTTFLLLRAG